MLRIEEIPVPGCERVAYAEEPEAGYRGSLAVHRVLHRRGSAALAGLTVALQGCGNVGRHLALLLRGAGGSTTPR